MSQSTNSFAAWRLYGLCCSLFPSLVGRGYSVVAINFVAFALYLSLAIIQTPWLFIPIHILRSGLQGANVPVETSMIVDTTRSELVGQ